MRTRPGSGPCATASRPSSPARSWGPERDSPSSLFRLLCAALPLGARINASLAVRAAKALADQGWTTAEKLASSTFQLRTKALNEAGYARYDEQTSRYLGETADLLLERYRGDLRRLRDEAERHPERERRLGEGV